MHACGILSTGGAALSMRAGARPFSGSIRALAVRPRVSRTAGVRMLSVRAETEYDYDLFTIGAGSGGVRASRMSTQYGVKVAAVELPYNPISSDTQGGMGGTCVIRGCVPKKLMVYASHYSEDFKDAEGYGWTIPEKPTFDWTKLVAAKNKELDRLVGVYGRIMGNNNVEMYEGRGTIVDAHTVDVNGKQFKCKNILVATGGRAFVPDIPGKELCITSDEALNLPAMPKKIAIVGSGYIALEFACIFKQLGAEVHVYYRQPLPLRGFDEEVRNFLAEQLTTKGIHMHHSTTPTSVTKKEGGGLTFTHSDGDIDVDEVMMATGRKPNVANLGLEKAGVELLPSGAIKVDEFSQTTCPSIWAIGDVTDRINLTPVALMEGMALSKTLFAGEPTKPDHKNVACAVFTQPQVGTVGMTEEEAVETCGDVDVYTSSFRPMKGTISGNEQRELMKLLVNATTDVVVGCHIVGGDAGEIMQGVGIAVKMGATKAQFDMTIGIHPTSAEELVTMRTATRQFRGGKLVEKK